MRHRAKTVILSLLIGITFFGVCVLFVLPTLSWPLPDVSPSANTESGTESDETPKTNYVSRWWLATDETEWYAIGDRFNWNDAASICVESAIAGKTLPDSIALSEIWGVSAASDVSDTPNAIIADENGTLTSPHLYLDVTFSITCTGLPQGTLYDEPLWTEDNFSVALGDQHISVYEYETASFTGYGEELRTFRNLSDEFDIDHHGTVDLEIGQTVRARAIYVISETVWQDGEHAVLFTPFYGLYSTDILRRIHFTQPHALLNTLPEKKG